MAGVFCPTCESVVSASAAYCLACGHDLTVQGPITSTGHDLNQLKEVVRLREDLSMAEKFDIIAKVEEGANPILLGIAAPADRDDRRGHGGVAVARRRAARGRSGRAGDPSRDPPPRADGARETHARDDRPRRVSRARDARSLDTSTRAAAATSPRSRGSSRRA